MPGARDSWRRNAGRTPAKNGLIEPPPPRFRREDRVGVLYVRLPAKSDSSPAWKPRERVAVLLTLLGSSRRIKPAWRGRRTGAA